MNREQMIEKGAAAVYEENFCDCGCPVSDAAGRFFAKAFIDALLPQVTTVEELEALQTGTVVVDNESEGHRLLLDGWWRSLLCEGDFTADDLIKYAPLTIVWQP